RRSRYGVDYWPGFVDAMATLLLLVTFLLALFMLSQFFVTKDVLGKDTALQRLTRQISQLTELLALEKGSKQSLEEQLAAVTSSLSGAQSERDRLQGLLSAAQAAQSDSTSQVISLQTDLEGQKSLSDEAAAKVELLNQQILALRRQIDRLNGALNASQAEAVEDKQRIEDLGKRLNVALARKVEELERYRSDFFGQLRTLLAGRDDIRVDGDRFVFQSEILFDPGAAQLSSDAGGALRPLADAIRELSREIPEDLDWVLRIDGHTDARPINSPEFPSNWELSSARAQSVLYYFLSQGIPPQHLVAAGFGEFQPIDTGTDAEALRRNRRIELKLTTR
ncbi:MAG: peptidoglycan -binding protein, partial [Pseudomonadota bacterium]